jgi:hypothetical protein
MIHSYFDEDLISLSFQFLWSNYLLFLILPLSLLFLRLFYLFLIFISPILVAINTLQFTSNSYLLLISCVMYSFLAFNSYNPIIISSLTYLGFSNFYDLTSFN